MPISEGNCVEPMETPTLSKLNLLEDIAAAMVRDRKAWRTQIDEGNKKG